MWIITKIGNSHNFVDDSMVGYRFPPLVADDDELLLVVSEILGCIAAKHDIFVVYLEDEVM